MRVTRWYALTVSGHGITPIFDDSVYTADHVVLYSDFYLPPDQPLPSGVLTITQNILVSEDDAMDYGKRVAIISHTFTFDTTAGNTQSIPPNEQIVSLSGETYLTMFTYYKELEGAYSGRVETKKVSLDGVKLRVLSEYLPTGIRVTITPAEVPPDWDDAMTSSLLTMTDCDIYDQISHAGVLAELLIDGESDSEAQQDGWDANELVYILPIFPDHYSKKQDVRLALSLAYNETFKGTDQIGGEVYNMPADGFEHTGTIVSTPLIDITIPIP